MSSTLIASAAAIMLLVTFVPDDADARGRGGYREVAEPTAVALSQFEDLGAAALSQCGAQAIGAAIAVTGTGATAVQRRSAQPLSARPPSVQLRRGPTAAAATTLTATGFAINPVPRRWLASRNVATWARREGHSIALTRTLLPALGSVSVEASFQIIENIIHPLLKPVVSLSGCHHGIYLVFEGHAFRVVDSQPKLPRHPGCRRP